MNPERLNEYNAKCSVLQNATVEADRLAKIVIAAGKILEQDWRRVTIGGIAESGSLSSSDTQGRSMLSIDGQSWPSASQLAMAFINYKKARLEAHRLYQELLASGARVPKPEDNINMGMGSWR